MTGRSRCRSEAMIEGLRRGFFSELFRAYVPEESVEEQWDVEGLVKVLADDWQITLPIGSDDRRSAARLLQRAFPCVRTGGVGRGTVGRGRAGQGAGR